MQTKFYYIQLEEQLINFMEINWISSKVVSFSHNFFFTKYFFSIQIIYYSFQKSLFAVTFSTKFSNFLLRKNEVKIFQIFL